MSASNLSTPPSGSTGGEIDPSKPGYVMVNRNFCTFPLARDPRVRCEFEMTRSGWWRAPLPGDERLRWKRVTLFLPKGSERSLRRAPTAFDMNVLFGLLRLSQIFDSPELRFGSPSQLLRKLGMTNNGRLRRQLQDSLRYWERVQLRFERWYHPVEKRKRRGETYYADASRERRDLLPPIDSLRTSDSGMRLIIDGEWFEELVDAKCGYFVPVPWPLPKQAPALNLALHLMTVGLIAFDHPDDQRWQKLGIKPIRSDRRMKFVNWVKLRRLCRTIGLDHTSRNRQLDATAKAAASYFAQHGGSLGPMVRDGEIGFICDRPKVKKPKKQKASATRPKLQRAPVKAIVITPQLPQPKPILFRQYSVEETKALREARGEWGPESGRVSCED